MTTFNNNDDTHNDIIDTFKEKTLNTFSFSPFQTKSCNAIIDEKHVLVTAHTGSGKTLPAEFAIYYAFHSLGKKVIYTSPIKALSNQKYDELCKKFPDIDVGILTGDVKHNPGASLLIMTTEILQNHCFKSRMNNKTHLDFDMDLESELGIVIFDEVHYIDDPDRGTVWEQTMMMLPRSVQFVMLSATIGAKERFADWVANITQREVEVCSTNHRVVPLEFSEFFTVPDKYIEHMKDKTRKQLFMNKLADGCLNTVKTPEQYNKSVLSKTKKVLHEMSKDRYQVPQKFVINECIKELKSRDMFPCLFFVFSRKQVEHIALQITTNLYDEGEKDSTIEPMFRQLLVSKVRNWKEYMELPEYSTYVALLEKGIGLHHAGMLPIFKEMMEILYTKKCIKVLVATETFAIGLNMPTRTVVFTSLFKHDGVQKRVLKSHEFIQMAGRAGRRNIDTKGHVIILTNCYEPLDETQYYNLFHSSPKVLKSRFRLNYNLLLGFSNGNTEDELVGLVERSMMNKDIEAQRNSSREAVERTNQFIAKRLQTLNFEFKAAQEFFLRLGNMENMIQMSKGKSRMKFRRELDELLKQNESLLKHRDDYMEMEKLYDELAKEESMLQYASNFVRYQVRALSSILQSNGFVSENEESTELTPWGVNSSYLHELPCLAFMDFYNRFLCKESTIQYNAVDITSLLSCFYPVKVPQSERVNVPPFLKEEIEYIQSRLHWYCDAEEKHEMFITHQFEMQYDLMEIMRTWCNDVHDNTTAKVFFDSLTNVHGIFKGDFVKACLKVVNMINEIKVVCSNDENYHMFELLELTQTQLQKSIVSCQSLYL